MTDALRPYSEYKDSGLPWLGEIPAHWNILRSKRLFSERKERARDDDEQLSATQSHGVIRQSDYERHVGRKVTRILLHLDKRKHVEKDDFVISMRSFQGGLERAWCQGAIRSSYVVLSPGSKIYVPYFAHLFKCHSYIQALRATSDFIRDGQDLTFSNFSLVDLPVLPLPEQHAIADYLDANAALVRKFIRNRRRLIEALSEQKQAIINQAVTRGLDPTTPLKPSGVDWLGDIPSHWHVKPLKHWAAINKLVLPETTASDYEFSYIDIGAVGTGLLLEQPERIRFSNSPSRARRILRRGDTIISTVRTYLKAVLFIREEPHDLIASTGFAVLSPNPGVVPEALSLAVQSKVFVENVTANSTGIGYPAIAETRLGTLHIALPPTTQEQEGIVERANRATAQLNAAIIHAQREIDLIREYRTRLIADVVTGKLDVRQHATQTPSAKKSKATANVHFRRSVFAAEIVHRLHDESTFGHVKFEKLMFLCEKRCGVDTGSTYHRQAAGPYDNRALRSIDSQLKKLGWYEARKGDKGYRYESLEKAGGHKEYFERYFGEVVARFDEVIETFRTLNTQRCEIVATLYAAWEDLLAKGETTDDQIIEQVLHHWHPSKRKIDEDRWRRALGWMKTKGLTPDNMGGAT